METLELLKYLGIGVVGLVVCLMILAIIGNILRLMLDIVVFVIITPFYILFHPVLFVTKPMTCFKNIFIKTPCFGEEYAFSKIKIDPKSLKNISKENYKNSFTKEREYFEREEEYYRSRYGTDLFGNKIK